MTSIEAQITKVTSDIENFKEANQDWMNGNKFEYVLELQKEKNLLLERQSVKSWTLKQLLDWSSRFIFDTEGAKTEITSAFELDQPAEFVTWSSLPNMLQNFRNNLEANGQFYKPIIDLDPNQSTAFSVIRDYESLCERLNRIFTETISKIIGPPWSFEFRPNRAKSWADIYLCKYNDRSYSAALGEVKVRNLANGFNQDDLHGYYQFAQLVNELTSHYGKKKKKMMFITNYAKTYLFYYLGEERVEDGTNEYRLLVSSELGPNQLVLVVLFMLCIDFQDIVLQGIKRDQLMRDLEANESDEWKFGTSTRFEKWNPEELVNDDSHVVDDDTKDPDWSPGHDYQLSDSHLDATTSYNLNVATPSHGVDTPKNRKEWFNLVLLVVTGRHKCEMIGYGGCGKVNTAVDNDINLESNSAYFFGIPGSKKLEFLKINVFRFGKFVAKVCHIDKSSEEALKQLNNEYRILRELNKSQVSCVPTVHYYGQVTNKQVLVMDYIDGKTLDKFENMNEKVRKSCIQCINELHDKKVTHGDIRAENILVLPDDRVIMIDFGLSKLESRKSELRREMDYLLKHCLLE